jgi:hypothetical protein
MRTAVLLFIVALSQLGGAAFAQDAGQKPAKVRISLLIYYLKDSGLLQAFEKDDATSKDVQARLKANGGKVVVEVEGVDQNKNGVAKGKREFHLEPAANNKIRITATDESTSEPETTTGIFVTLDATKAVMFNVKIIAKGFDTVDLKQLHAQEQTIAVVMPLAKATTEAPKDLQRPTAVEPLQSLLPCNVELVDCSPPCWTYPTRCRFFRWRR